LVYHSKHVCWFRFKVRKYQYDIIDALVQIRRVRGWYTPWKRAFTRWLGFLSVHLLVKFLSKGVRYARIKILARTFHSLVSFAHKNWCTLTTLFNRACVMYIKLWLYISRLVSYCLTVFKLHVYSWLKNAFYFNGLLLIKRMC